MPRCLIYTCAYNAEKTLPRVAESVLTQTFEDFTWYILDNGSTDATGEYIKSLAKKDERIKYLHNKKNYVWEKGNTVNEVINNNSSYDYFCWIDSDDAYEKTFIKVLVKYLEKNNCDVVCCGFKGISAETEKVLYVNNSNFEGIIKDKTTFEAYFPYYYGTFRTYWGKMYRMSVLLKTDTKQLPKLYYGWDTLFSLEVLANSQSVGALNTPLYKYYISKKSGSYKYDSLRIDSDRLLFEYGLSYLKRKCGRVTSANLIFLFGVYLSAMSDTYNTIINSTIKVPEMIKELHKLVISKYTNFCLATDINTNDDVYKTVKLKETRLFTKIASWLLTCREVPDELVEDYVETAEMCCTIIKNTDGWIYFEKLRIQFLIMQHRIDEAREKVNALKSLLPNDTEVQTFEAQLL